MSLTRNHVVLSKSRKVSNGRFPRIQEFDRFSIRAAWSFFVRCSSEENLYLVRNPLRLGGCRNAWGRKGLADSSLFIQKGLKCLESLKEFFRSQKVGGDEGAQLALACLSRQMRSPLRCLIALFNCHLIPSLVVTYCGDEDEVGKGDGVSE